LLDGRARLKAGVSEGRSSAISSVKIACSSRSRGSSMPTSVARTISSRNSGETDMAMLREGRPWQAGGRRYRVRKALLSTKRMPWATPAGAQTARPGGAIQEPASVQTVIKPAETWIS
jgi:hypothetical protein